MLSRLGVECALDAGGGDGLTTARIGGDRDESARLTIAIGRRAAPCGTDFVCGNDCAAACFILSRALRMPAPILTADAGMFAVVRDALAAARGLAPILIEGETGVGKKALARLVHAAGGAPREPIDLDCAALDRAKDALFGLLDGRSTPPAGDPPRTVILDRIAELSPADRSRLIAAIRSSGGRPPPIRLIATAGRSVIGTRGRGALPDELRGTFPVTLTIPPLRRRRMDIAALARHFLRGISPAAALDAGAIRALQEYPFPGNVRELRNLMTRLAIMWPPSADCGGGSGRAAITMADARGQIAGAYQAAGADSVVWTLTRERVRRRMAQWALAAAGGDRYKAAASLGLQPSALLRLIAPASKSRRPR